MSDVNIFKSVSDIRRILVQDFFSLDVNLSTIAGYIGDFAKTEACVEDNVINVNIAQKNVSEVEEGIRMAIVVFLQDNKLEILRSFIMASGDGSKIYSDIITHPEWVYDTINMNSHIVVRF